MARILVVDDEADMRMALANVLSRLGHQVYEAGDGPTALQFLSREGADLVLLDMRLPGMDGVQILRKLREVDGTTPVVMVTGYGSVESAVEVMQLGASHYLAKPFSNRELRETVDRVLTGGKAPEGMGVLGRRLAEKVRGVIAPLDARPAPLPARGRSAGPAKREASGWPWLLAGALIAGAFCAWILWTLYGRQAGRDFAIPHENATALVWRGDRLWSADWVTQSVYEYERRGNRLEVVRSVHLPETHITGIAVSGEHLYVCDSWKREIQKRRLDERFSLVRAYRSPGPNPAGVYFDGRYLWSSDASERRFYQHGIDAGLTVLESYPAPGRAPSSIFKDGSYFWSADSETRMIYRHRLDARLGVLAVYSLPLLNEGGAPLSGFTLRGDDVWMGRDGSGTVHVRPLSAFEERIREEIP
ncbi:MAG: response regulator [Elusimicrobiota bacterium]